MNTHRRLVVWQDSQRLVYVVYRIAKQLPAAERFSASEQLRRAAWSVHNNISEGNARRGRGELRQFINVAIGSLAEVDAMIATLSGLYALEPEALEEFEAVRRILTARLFALLRANPR